MYLYLCVGILALAIHCHADGEQSWTDRPRWG